MNNKKIEERLQTQRYEVLDMLRCDFDDHQLKILDVTIEKLQIKAILDITIDISAIIKE